MVFVLRPQFLKGSPSGNGKNRTLRVGAGSNWTENSLKESSFRLLSARLTAAGGPWHHFRGLNFPVIVNLGATALEAVAGHVIPFGSFPMPEVSSISL